MKYRPRGPKPSQRRAALPQRRAEPGNRLHSLRLLVGAAIGVARRKFPSGRIVVDDSAVRATIVRALAMAVDRSGPAPGEWSPPSLDAGRLDLVALADRPHEAFRAILQRDWAPCDDRSVAEFRAVVEGSIGPWLKVGDVAASPADEIRVVEGSPILRVYFGKAGR